MSRSRWLFSIWLLWHLFAMALTALPAAERIPPIGAPRYPTDDPVAARLTPLLDRTASALRDVASGIAVVSGPVRDAARVYLRTLGLSQNWSMFWDPPRTDLYVRVRYYVGTGASPSWSATELVYPALFEDHIRFSGYRVQHRDKSILAMLVEFQLNREETPGIEPDEEFPPDLAPIASYFARRFEAAHLQAHEQILRTEVWSASPRNPPRGTRMDPEARQARLERVRAYYDGPVERVETARTYGTALTGEPEADLVWVLQYVDQMRGDAN